MVDGNVVGQAVVLSGFVLGNGAEMCIRDSPMCAYDPETDKIVDYDARPYSRGWCHSESSEIIICLLYTSIIFFIQYSSFSGLRSE